MTEHETVHVRPGLGARLRAYFLTGLVIAGPLAATAYITWWVVDTVDSWVKPLIPERYSPDAYLNFHIPGVGLVIALLGLTLLGFLAANLAGRTLLGFGERLLDGMPVVRGLYKSLKQVFETVFSQSGSSFRKVGLVEFPNKGCWSIVFISSQPAPGLARRFPNAHEDLVSVFLPCTPNPTTGFYFFLPARDVIEIPMTPDAAAKLIMSAGLIQAEMQDQLSALAEAGKAQRKPAAVESAPN
jgi:uncharacterized membrane protein